MISSARQAVSQSENSWGTNCDWARSLSCHKGVHIKTVILLCRGCWMTCPRLWFFPTALGFVKGKYLAACGRESESKLVSEHRALTGDPLPCSHYNLSYMLHLASAARWNVFSSVYQSTWMCQVNFLLTHCSGSWAFRKYGTADQS